VNLVRWKKLDAESLLRQANGKFKQRFTYLEEKARTQGKNLAGMSLDEMESYWQEAKRGGAV